MIGLAFFVYKRPGCTKKVIESIRKNHFEKIYIFQDGLKKESDRADWEEVSGLIRSIGFAETEILISDKNKGLADSIVDGMAYVFARHDMAVALEDDIVLADGYKSIMEAMFEKYKDNRKVMSICGGGLGIAVPEAYEYDAYFSYRISSVAFGTWRNRWKGFGRNARILAEIYKDGKKKEMLRFAGTDIAPTIFASMKGENNTWAAYWQLHVTNHEGYHAIPTLGYATDIGREGGGTNTIDSMYRYDVGLGGRAKEDYNLPDEVFVDADIRQNTNALMDIAENKLQCYFDILCMWMRLYQNNLNTLKFFRDKEISKIYIYGTGNLAEFLYWDVHSAVEIAGYVVENAKDNREYRGKKVYDMRNYKGMEDVPVIVTPSYDIAFIKHFFKKCGIKNEVILIEDVVKYVLGEGRGLLC